MATLNKKTITLEDYSVKCGKCKKGYIASLDKCPICNPPVKEQSLTEIKPSGPIITEWKVSDGYRVSGQLKETLTKHGIRGISAEMIDEEGKRYLELTGIHIYTKRKFGLVKRYDLENAEDIEAMRLLCIETIEKYGKLLVDKGVKLGVEQIRFLLDEEYRNECYNFELGFWKIKTSHPQWKYLAKASITGALVIILTPIITPFVLPFVKLMTTAV